MHDVAIDQALKAYPPTATPRTDAECIQIYTEDVTGCVDAVDYVCASFARELEKELARLRADNLTAHQMACAAGLERDQLRAEVERLCKQRDNLLKPMREQAIARAERAEAELANEKARLDWLLENAHDPYVPMVSDRAAIDAAMNASEV